MRLTYYGHCAFRWETPGGVTVMADPYRNQAGRYWFSRLFPEIHCDLGLISHAHFDHDAAERLPEPASVLRTPGEFVSGDLQIRGIGDFHSGPSRLSNFPNVMFRLEVNGVRYLHIGDNRVDWPPMRWSGPLGIRRRADGHRGRLHPSADLRRGGRARAAA